MLCSRSKRAECQVEDRYVERCLETSYEHTQAENPVSDMRGLNPLAKSQVTPV